MLRSPLFAYRVSGAADGKESPFARDALQLVRPVLFELEARPGNEVADRARDEHLPRPGQGSDARADVDRDAGDLLLVQLTLAGVHADPNVEAEALHSLDDRLAAPNRARRPVEPREEPVAGGVHFDTPEAGELPPNDLVVPSDDVPPGTVSDSRRMFRRPHQVGEEDSGENGVRHMLLRRSLQECLDRLDGEIVLEN